MNDIIVKLKKLIKLCNISSLVLFMVLFWGELILAFTQYKSIGVLIYEEYGYESIGYFYLSVIIIIYFIQYIRSRLEDLIVDITKVTIKK